MEGGREETMKEGQKSSSDDGRFLHICLPFVFRIGWSGRAYSEGKFSIRIWLCECLLCVDASCTTKLVQC